MAGEKGFDGRDQCGDAVEDATADGLLAQFAKPAFDQIRPRRAGRREVEFEARMLFQPTLHFGVFMSAVVVQDQMQIERLWVTRIQGAQKLA